MALNAVGLHMSRVGRSSTEHSSPVDHVQDKPLFGACSYFLGAAGARELITKTTIVTAGSAASPGSKL